MVFFSAAALAGMAHAAPAARGTYSTILLLRAGVLFCMQQSEGAPLLYTPVSIVHIKAPTTLRASSDNLKTVTPYHNYINGNGLRLVVASFSPVVVHP